MKRHYLWLAILPVVAAGGIWAYAQEPDATQPPNGNSVRYRQNNITTASPSPSGQAFSTRPSMAPSSVAGYAVNTPAIGFPAQLAYPNSWSNPPVPPGVPAVASFPGQPGFAPELLELEVDNFKIVSKENPTQEDWQTDRKAKEKLSIAMQKLRSTDVDDKEVEESRTLVANYLDAQFDHDLTKREQQISDLQKQIDKLKSQLEKRKTSKEKMIEMRLTLMENETNGLGFPPAWNALPSTNGGPTNYYVPAPNFAHPQPQTYQAPSLPGPNSSSYSSTIYSNTDNSRDIGSPVK